MRQLLPTHREAVDAYDLYRPADPTARMLRLDMVTSVDGCATDEHGGTAELGGLGDAEVFRALRALSDGILVGAGTVRQEGYGPHRLSPELAIRRRDDGRRAPAAVVVVSRSLDLDLDAPLFSAAVTPTVVLTCQASPRSRRRDAERAGRVVVAGTDLVDLGEGLRRLRDELGLANLVCEGGPTLNGWLLSGGLVDELCVTLTPALLGAVGPPMVRGLADRLPLELTSLAEQDGDLFARYRVQNRRSSAKSAPRSSS
ncbi:MAG: dihydrofolate reductase family protein [Actinobacteria bacterium]|nr:dihydrofolate reductase family protein [Actinomycetota bacterium]